MKTKLLIVITVAIAAIFSLVGCGGSGGNFGSPFEGHYTSYGNYYAEILDVNESGDFAMGFYDDYNSNTNEYYLFLKCEGYVSSNGRFEGYISNPNGSSKRPAYGTFKIINSDSQIKVTIYDSWYVDKKEYVLDRDDNYSASKSNGAFAESISKPK